MSTTFTPTGTGDPVLSYTEVQDGDAPDAASVTVFLEGLAEDAARIHAGGTVDAIEERNLPLIWQGLTETAAASYWTIGNTGQPVQTGSAAELPLYVHLDMPHGAQITVVSSR